MIAGDLVAGTGTVVIDPPEGDMHAYLRSLHRLLDLAPRTLYPAHGPVVAGGAHLLQGYIAHRLERENKVVAALEQHQGGTPEELVPAAYPDVSPVLYPLAARSLLAHLLKLVEDKRVKQTGARFELL
ncbi:MAG: hypothetical protein JST92_11625 [Deltaproteobacteria bacterium]|nr:hypothetical protein [Deltaproteobacteria bacterium]